MNVLIDSSVWLEFFGAGSKFEKSKKIVFEAKKQTHITSPLVLFEVYKKIKIQKNEEAADKAVASIVDSTEIILVSQTIALNAADISLQTGLSMADAIIKSTANLSKSKLITLDNHFRGLDNVQII
ncbi:MAG: type II toxin-antitoxin system VapC family toxin [Candidatus Diapherotrites archaeon]|nr:type II toxin-antitoxin system VapC family toxin [Candidatus Diapherotrites archaeon]